MKTFALLSLLLSTVLCSTTYDAKKTPNVADSKATLGDVVVAESDVSLDEESLQARQVLLDPCEEGQGVCMSSLECGFQSGNTIGNCDSGNVCCHMSKTCQKGKLVEITTNNTYFVEPKKIWDPEGPVQCGVSVKKINTIGTSICQMRLDFVNFNSVGPDPKTGQCNYDMLTVEQGDANSQVHKLCGLNDGQHVYVDVKHTDSIKLRMNIDYSKDPNRLRKWNIRITQIPCHSPRLAPPGCLQYFEDHSGMLKSFNYGPQGVNETSYPLGTRYSICFKRGPDSCRVYLKRAGPFGLGEAPSQLSPLTKEEVSRSEIDEECFNQSAVTRTYVSKAYLALDNVKFCGNHFADEYRTENNGVNVMNFVSPSYEAVRDQNPPIQPPGFKFYYRLMACGSK